MKNLFSLSFFMLSMIGSVAAEATHPPLSVVPELNLPRYMGTWYEIARLPNRFQQHCEGDVVATYTLQAGGNIRVVNRCRKADGQWSEAVGRAKLAGKSGPNTKLKVRFAPAFLSFLPAVWGDYWILDLAPDYSYAVVGEPARKYLWILSRTTSVDEVTLQAILERLRLQDYDLSGLLRTRQSAH